MKSHFRFFFFVAQLEGQASDSTMVFYDSVTGSAKPSWLFGVGIYVNDEGKTHHD